MNVLAKSWFSLLFRGAASVLFGILTLAVPSSTRALVAIFGVYALADGVASFAIATFVRDRQDETGGLCIGRAFISFFSGMIALVYTGITPMSLYAVISAWAIATGTTELILVSQNRAVLAHQHASAKRFMVTGTLSIVFGALMLLLPAVGVYPLFGFIGVYALMEGLAGITMGVQIHHLFPAEVEA